MTTQAREVRDLDSALVAKKSRRVRTGCLTCRDRHIKCDEGAPKCSNCRKSNRTCERGVRLNYQGLKSHSRHYIPPGEDWLVEFHDESLKIASGYLGGLQRYSDRNMRVKHIPRAHCPVSVSEEDCRSNDFSINWYDLDEDQTAPSISSQSRTLGQTQSDQVFSDIPDSQDKDRYIPQAMSPTTGEVDFLGSLEEIDYMQVFVYEVGVWMDLFDKERHFSETSPHEALRSPMLRNAMLSCGAKQLALREDKAEKTVYYDTATSQLRLNLFNPERDTAECAAAAVVLNVHEMMCGRPVERMSHAKGARVLIQESGWNGKSDGFGGACFWLAMSIEVLGCLASNSRIRWSPADWGVDESDEKGDDAWARRIFFILAKIVDFRASATSQGHQHEPARSRQLSEWQGLRRACDKWNESCPRTMCAISYLYKGQLKTPSCFPRIWLIKRAAVLGRLFYHMSLCVLSQIHPLEPAAQNEEKHAQLLDSAHQICGIVAHSQGQSQGVAPVAVRALATAAVALKTSKERDEVLVLLRQVGERSGWDVRGVEREMRAAWGVEIKVEESERAYCWGGPRAVVNGAYC